MKATYLVLITVLCCLGLDIVHTAPRSAQSEPIQWEREIIYHIFQRSFYDADGNGHGDLKGLAQKLDYLKELGVTTVLCTPLYASHFYHNYYPTDYETIDPLYGTKEDYLQFVREVHQRGMKFILDQEVQYASNGHPWFDESLHYPESPYADFIYYNDSLNQEPEPGYFHYEFIHTYENKVTRLTHLDLNHETVKRYMQNYFLYWIDPDGDGNFEDGVDGFRIDHMMDNLDFKDKFTNLYQAFWNPIFAKSKALNPDVFFLAEQAAWGYGDDLLRRSKADAVFGFPLYRGILSFKARTLAAKLDSTQALLPANSAPVVFIENHDTNRFASEVEGDLDKMRLGAVLNLLLPGIPSIYYGQELGLPGTHGSWGHDGNAIPVREAFPWSVDVDAQGLALWYKDTGPWWDQSIYRTGKSASLALEKQQEDPTSLFNFYRRLIDIRKSHEAFYAGDYRWIDLGSDDIFSFSRRAERETALVLINLSNRAVSIPGRGLLEGNFENMMTGQVERSGGDYSIELPAYGFKILIEAEG